MLGRARSRGERLGFAPYISGGLVCSQAEKCRVTQVTVGRPLDESNLGHQCWSDPLHFAHLLSCDPGAPVRSLAVWQVDKGTLRNLQRLDLAVDLASQERCESGAHLSSKS